MHSFGGSRTEALARLSEADNAPAPALISSEANTVSEKGAAPVARVPATLSSATDHHRKPGLRQTLKIARQVVRDASEDPAAFVANHRESIRNVSSAYSNDDDAYSAIAGCCCIGLILFFLFYGKVNGEPILKSDNINWRMILAVLTAIALLVFAIVIIKKGDSYY